MGSLWLSKHILIKQKPLRLSLNWTILALFRPFSHCLLYRFLFLTGEKRDILIPGCDLECMVTSVFCASADTWKTTIRTLKLNTKRLRCDTMVVSSLKIGNVFYTYQTNPYFLPCFLCSFSADLYHLSVWQFGISPEQWVSRSRYL